MKTKLICQSVFRIIIGLLIALPAILFPITVDAGELYYKIDFESPPLDESERQVVNPYLDQNSGVTFTAEPNYAGAGIVGIVKNSETSVCAEPRNADQKLGTASVGSNLIGYGTFPIRATFPQVVSPPVTISAEFQTGLSTTIRIRLYDAYGIEVANASDSDLSPDGTCGYPGNPRAREKLTITSEHPVSYAVLDVYPPAYVMVIDNFEISYPDRNQYPIAEPSSPTSGLEGFPFVLDGTGSYDPDGDPLTYLWTGYTEGCVISDRYNATPEVTCPDNGLFVARLEVSDGQSTDWDTTQTMIENVSPSVGLIGVGSLVQTGTFFEADADFSDKGRLDTFTASWDWGDGSISGATKLHQEPGSGEAFGSHTYLSPGVYTIKLTVTDDDGGSGSSEYQNVVAYDPDGGFVTGGGWIWSGVGTYPNEPEAAGWANFGFVAKYHKGAEVPDGQAELVFHTAGMNFHSTEYEWLVVTGGDTARLKGKGTLNGDVEYKFMIWARDGETDTFRIKIWEEINGEELVVYDNSLSHPQYENGQSVGNGNILVQEVSKPIKEALDQSHTGFMLGYWFDEDDIRWQEFLPTKGNLSSVDVYLGKNGNPGNVIVEIRSLEGTLLRQKIIPAEDVHKYGWVNVGFSTPIDLIPRTKYRIYVYSDQESPTPENRYFWFGDRDSPYDSGCETDLAYFMPDFDYAFKTYSISD